jgi:hypothetical protein
MQRDDEIDDVIAKLNPSYPKRRDSNEGLNDRDD